MEHKSNFLCLVRCLALVVMIVLLVTGCARAYRALPPGSGTITKVGSHPQYYGGFDAPTVYYVGIKSDAHPGTYWTWYVDKDIYSRYQVGDYINVFGTPFRAEKGERTL